MITTDKELAALAQDGNEGAMLELLERHNGLIRSQAMRWFFIGRDLDHDDLMQAGRLGFMQGVHTYNPERGTKLTTWCTYAVMTEVGDEVNRLGETTMGRNMYFDMQKIKKVDAELFQTLKREPTDTELAERMDITVRRVRSLKQALYETGDPLSFDEPLDFGDGSELTDLHDVVSSDYNLEEEYMKKELIVQALEGVNDLPDEQREVIQLRYFEGYTWEEIENHMQISRRTAVRREAEALDALGVLLQV